jgi:hypothetical protein
MAFDLRGFQFNRGVAAANAQGAGVTSVIHTYKSLTDTLATIGGASYFPNNIDGATDKVFINDLLSIVASDGTSMVRITALDPFTTGTDLYLGSSSSITVAAPVAATDANGLIISGGVATLEFADATNPGIVSIDAQQFTGDKLFNNSVITDVINRKNVNDRLFIGADVPGFTQIGVTGSGQGALISYIDGIDAGGGGPVPVRIGSIPTQTSYVQLGDIAAAPVRIPSGLFWPVGGGFITQYENADIPVSWTGPFTAAQPGRVHVQRFEGLNSTDKVTFITITGIPAAAATNTANITTATVLPADFRPLVDTHGICLVTDNTAFATGSFVISTAGVITIFASATQNQFTNAGTAGTGIISLSYNNA